MNNPLIKQLLQRGSLSEQEKQALDAAIGGVRNISPDEEIIVEGMISSESTLLVAGFAARYKDLPNGKRQILSLHVKGDFVDLHSFLLKKMDHSVIALTPCTLAWVPHERLRDITEQFPNLTRQLWLSTLVDAAIHREWLVTFGRRPALASVAHLICELFVRLTVVDEVEDFKFRLPITQEELADARGISLVHLNRSIQELRARGLISWRGEEVRIEDWKNLRALAGFDPNYLRLEGVLPG